MCVCVCVCVCVCACVCLSCASACMAEMQAGVLFGLAMCLLVAVQTLIRTLLLCTSNSAQAHIIYEQAVRMSEVHAHCSAQCKHLSCSRHGFPHRAIQHSKQSACRQMSVVFFTVSLSFYTASKVHVVRCPLLSSPCHSYLTSQAKCM